MDITQIKLDSLIKDLFSYKKVDFEVINKEIKFKITKEYGNEFYFEGTLDKSILKDVPKDDIESILFKNITNKYITSNTMILELLVRGSNTYHLYWNNNYDSLSIKRRDNFLINFFYRSEFMKEKEEYSLTNEEFKELINSATNIFEKLRMTGYHINFLEDQYGPKNILERIIYKNNPEKFLTHYNEQKINSMAIDFYNGALNDVSKKFWKKILEKDEMLKNLNNPLLKQKDYDLPLFQYKLTGQCYKGDGYETWKSDIEKYYISNKPLDEQKLKYLFENNESEIRDILNLYVERLNNNETYHRNMGSCFFIEVTDKEDYIIKNNNHRFLYLGYVFYDDTKEAKKYNKNSFYDEDEWDLDEEITKEESLSNVFDKTIITIEDTLVKEIAKEMDININNKDNQLDVFKVRETIKNIKDSIEYGESFEEISKDLFKLLQLSNIITLKDKEYKEKQFEYDMER